MAELTKIVVLNIQAQVSAYAVLVGILAKVKFSRSLTGQQHSNSTDTCRLYMTSEDRIEVQTSPSANNGQA